MAMVKMSLLADEIKIICFVLLASLVAKTGPSVCTEHPPRIHFSSSLLLKSSSDTLKNYYVDEYVDLTGERSSLAVNDLKQGETRFYYNRANLRGYSERKFLEYNPTISTCKYLAIIDWPLSELRSVAIHMYDLATLRKDYVDIPIGPSVIYYAVLENAQDFKYITTIFSKTRLSNVDIYGRSMRPMPVGGWRNVDLIVHVPSRVNRKTALATGESLGDYLESVGAGAASPRRVLAARIAMVGACLRGKTQLTRQPDSAAAASPTSSIFYRNPKELDEDTFCDREHVRFVARFDIIAESKPGTLLGKTLSELNQGEHVFKRDPFALPVGIGCWGSFDENGQLAPSWQVSLSKSISMSKLSAEFVTTGGASDASFVAYDKQRHLLRLDSSGRKSVYDLLQRRSYHVRQFSSTDDFITSSLQQQQQQQQVSNLMERCIVLEMDQQVQKLDEEGRLDLAQTQSISPNPMLSGAHDQSLIEKLIGLNGDDNREHYMGTRTIDHIEYEVFEREWNANEQSDTAGGLPILLRADGFKPASNGDDKLYLTYYVRLDETARGVADKEAVNRQQATGPLDVVNGPFDATAPSASSPLMLIKFIELWQFDRELKRRSIVNRLRFVEFSWSFDVEPTNDFDKQIGGQSPTLRLFNLEQCYQERARQAELIVDYRQQRPSVGNSNNNNKLTVATLRAHQLEVGEHLIGLLASTIELSRLQLVDLKLDILPTGDLVSSNRVVDLRNSLSELTQLANLNLRDRSSWDDGIVEHIFYSCHSLEECQLNSIYWPNENLLSYCPSARICALFKKGKRKDNFGELDELKRWYRSERVEADNSLVKKDGAPPPPPDGVCALYALRYKTVDERGFGDWRTASSTLDVNAWLLNRKTLELSLPLLDGSGGQQLLYTATPQVRQVKQLDTIGARLANERETLTGLQYTTLEDTPQSVNLNQRVRLSNSLVSSSSSSADKSSPFHHCQLACQMDDLCASFSVCSVAKKTQTGGSTSAPPDEAFDCVLSSLRLTSERAQKLVELAADAAAAADGEPTSPAASSGSDSRQFEMTLTGELYSQLFVMRRNDACSLHSRDFLADYKIVMSHFNLGRPAKKEVKEETTFSEIDSKSEREAERRGKKVEKISSSADKSEPRRRVSLDECAGLSFEMNVDETNLKEAKFTYCPLESQCFVRGDGNGQDDGAPMSSNNRLAGLGQCFVYAKRISRAYDAHRMHRLSIRAREGNGRLASADAGANGPSEATASGEQLSRARKLQSPGEIQANVLKLAKEHADEMENRWKVARTIWGLSEENCARECNLHKSVCLTFDSCRQGGKVLCLLYAIRSPLDQQGAYLPPLKLEQDLASQTDVSLASTLICDHYHLKKGYFDVRLRQLLDREHHHAETTALNEQEKINAKLDAIESAIMSADEEQDKREHAELAQDKASRLEKLNAARASGRSASSSFSLNALFLFAGLAFGCLGALFKDSLLGYSSAQMRNLPWLSWQANTRNRDDLNQLVQRRRSNNAGPF